MGFFFGGGGGEGDVGGGVFQEISSLVILRFRMTYNKCRPRGSQQCCVYWFKRADNMFLHSERHLVQQHEVKSMQNH